MEYPLSLSTLPSQPFVSSLTSRQEWTSESFCRTVKKETRKNKIDKKSTRGKNGPCFNTIIFLSETSSDSHSHHRVEEQNYGNTFSTGAGYAVVVLTIITSLRQLQRLRRSSETERRLLEGLRGDTGIIYFFATGRPLDHAQNVQKTHQRRCYSNCYYNAQKKSTRNASCRFDSNVARTGNTGKSNKVSTMLKQGKFRFFLCVCVCMSVTRVTERCQ